MPDNTLGQGEFALLDPDNNLLNLDKSKVKLKTK